MNWDTELSILRDDKTLIRNEYLTTLAKQEDFVSLFLLLFTGMHPSSEMIRMVQGILMIAIDHGIGNASTMSARLAASTNASIPQALIAGIASFGSAHGGATYDAAVWLSHNVAQGISLDNAITSARTQSLKIPGFGHALLHEDDRTEYIFSLAKECNYFRSHCAYALEIETGLSALKGKSIPLNIDGAIAAVTLDMGLTPDMAMCFFLIARVPGLLAHICEERNSGKGIRRLEKGDTSS